MAAKLLMVQGTASSVGKSLLVTALCRIFRQDGLRIAPFKAQNMSNNSYVTADGGEIGRAQASQAEAAGAEATTDMNPILLKPESDHRSQIVLNGRPFETVGARDYFRMKQTLWPAVTASLNRLRQQYDAVVIEGAGSPAEINLKEGDIVNMRVARYAGAPVLLVGDIDRGGVFAHLLGTLELLEPAERRHIRAFAINKFRGDAALLEPGLGMIEERTGVPVIGVVPYLHDICLPEEDAVELGQTPSRAGASIDIAIISLPHISNFDDFDPLVLEADVAVRYVTSPTTLGQPDLVILPGTKATIADLVWLRQRGLADAITAMAGSGTAVIGICGGYQMLSSAIVDLEGVESTVGRVEGLGLLAALTVFESAKVTHRVEARIELGAGLLAGAEGSQIKGYEIHMGHTHSEECIPFRIGRRSGLACEDDDGALSIDGWVLGTYLHGLFANDSLRSGLLKNLFVRKGLTRQPQGGRRGSDVYDDLAAAVRSALDMAFIHRLMNETAVQFSPLSPD